VSNVPEIHAWDLGKGETAVLSHSFINPDCVAIIDDSAARKCARTFQIPHKGTLGVVILAKKQGLISSAADVMHSLQVAGIRLDDKVIRTVLRETVGEDW